MELKQWFINFEGTKLNLSGDGCSEVERDHMFSGYNLLSIVVVSCQAL
jgi:hypothetical protein